MQANIFTKLKDIIRKTFFKKQKISDSQINNDMKSSNEDTTVSEINMGEDDIVASAFTKVPDYVVKRYRTRGS